MKGAPDERTRLGAFVNTISRADASRAAAVEQEGLCNDVGAVQTTNAERYNDVEGGGGSNVDYSDYSSSQGSNDNGVNGNRAA